MTEKHVVARVDEVPVGGCRTVEVDGRPIAIFNVGGSYFAIANRCPHEGAELAKGKLVGLVELDGPGAYSLSRKGELLKCPWHGWEYDLRTGQSYCDPRRLRVPHFDVLIESGADVVKGPYKVDTYPVSVDDEYLVIEA